jgi:hypothetical protein
MSTAEQASSKRKIIIAFFLLIICGIVIYLISMLVSLNYYHRIGLSSFSGPEIPPVLTTEIVTGCFIIFVCFLVYFYSSRKKSTANRLLQVSDWQSLGGQFFMREGDLAISVLLERAFQLGKLSVPLLPSSKIIDVNPDTGTIHATTETLTGGISMVRFTFEKKGMNATRVHIQSISTDNYVRNDGLPFRLGRGRYVKMDGSQNERNIATLTAYIREQSLQETPDTDSYYKNPQNAAVLSLVIPGLGQAFNGRSDEGMVIALGTGVGLMFYIVPGILIWLYGVYYAYSAARKMNDQVVPYRPYSVAGLVLAAGFGIVCLAAAYYIVGMFGLPGLVAPGMDLFTTCQKLGCFTLFGIPKTS